MSACKIFAAPCARESVCVLGEPPWETWDKRDNERKSLFYKTFLVPISGGTRVRQALDKAPTSDKATSS